MENSRAVLVFGADGRAQSSRKRENHLPSAVLRQEHLQEANSGPLSIPLVYSCNTYTCQIGLAPLSGLHLAADTVKCPQHKSYSRLQGWASRPQATRNRERGRKNSRGMAVTVIGGEDKRHECSQEKPELMSGWTVETSHIPQLWIVSCQAHKEWLVARKWLVLLQQM